MLTEQIVKRSLAVAERMRGYGQEKGYSEEKCNELFILGYIHNIGYALYDEDDCSKEHEFVGGRALQNVGYKHWRDVFYHSLPNSMYQSEYLDLLNLANMHTDNDGNYIGLDERLKQLAERGIPIKKLNSYYLIKEHKLKAISEIIFI